jgi:NAD(P)-dependent dehydrogenase (short-subunit alcohol dehydrogenase family)
LDTSINEKVDKCILDVKDVLKKEDLKLAGVVCNAGVMAWTPFEAEDMSTFKWIFSVKVVGHVRLVKGLVSTLRSS